MENNDANASGMQDNVGQSGAPEFSGTPGGSTQGPSNQSFDFTGSAGASDQQGLKDRTVGAIGSAGGKLADVGSSVRERAGNAKDKLASALEAGADRLRQRGQANALAGATAEGSAAIQGDGRLAQVSDRVAGGMERSAEWLRDADIDGLKSGIENQVKEHPGRTLLIAVGLGYLLGRAFRSNQ